MQRRDFSRSLLAAGTTAVAAAGGLTLTPALAQRVAPKEGTDFVRLQEPGAGGEPGQPDRGGRVLCLQLRPLLQFRAGV